MFQQVDQDIIPFAVGYDNGDTFIGNFAGNVGFGKHASASESWFLGLYIVGQIFPVFYFPYYLCVGIGRRAVVNSVYVT